MKMIWNVSDWLSYAGGALFKVADSASATVHNKQLMDILPYTPASNLGYLASPRKIFMGAKYFIRTP